ncbi:MAG: YitT family protein [Lachnospiraceae bacterium]|jgi:uncharacterized membrane-anchored protein YitT (DUF2179 family)|nr:YitT family protein [Lachnospiraceae bacterium]
MQCRKTVIMKYLLTFLGTGIVAFATASFFDTAGLVTGGFSGLAIVIRELTQKILPGGIPLAVTNLILNVPVLVIAAFLKGRHYLFRTLYGTLLTSFWLTVLPVVPLAEGDLLLSAIYGGVLTGAGIGMVFLGQATTGGTDLVAAVLQHFFRQYSIAKLMQVVDGLIVLTGICVFGVRMALYAMISIFLITKVSDGIVEGMKFSKAAFIITKKPDELANVLMDELYRGVTGLFSMGMYSRIQRNMLFCVVYPRQIVQLKALTLQMDPEAFVIVTDVREVLGEGFTEASAGETVPLRKIL